jgi:hypothetical protein
MRLWLDYYLWGIDNGIVDRVPNYEIESNIARGAGNYAHYDVWPAADNYKKIYPTGDARVGTLSDIPQVRTTTADFRDDVITRLTRPVNNDAFFVSTANARPAYQRADLLREYRWHAGHGTAMAAGQYHRFKNRLINGSENSTTAWVANLSGVFATGTISRHGVSPNAINTTNLEIPDRLLYTMPIEENFTISGMVAMTAEVAVDKDVGVLSAMIVEIAENGRVRIVARGSVDVRNPNPAGTLTRDVAGDKNLELGGHLHANYLFQPTDIIPGEFYEYTFEMCATEYTFRAGRQLGLLLFGADPEFTLRPFNGTEFTVNVGPRTFLQLPIIGYVDTDERDDYEKVLDLIERIIPEDSESILEVFGIDATFGTFAEIAAEIQMQLTALAIAHKIDIPVVAQWKVGDGGDGKFFLMAPAGSSAPNLFLGFGEQSVFVRSQPSAFVTKLSGNQNRLTITVVETYSDGSTINVRHEQMINNNAEGTYNVGGYRVFVNTKGNDQIREIRIVTHGTPAFPR